MFNTKKFYIIFSAVMLTLLTSCNFSNYQEKNTRAVFDFSSIYSVANNSRSALSDLIDANENIYADLKLEGGFTHNQTINLKESQIVQIENIPVGARITALVELYTITKNPDDDKEVKSILYKGQSKTYTIIEGENNIQIPLKKYKPADDPAVDPDEQNPAEDPNDPNNQSGGNGSEQEEDVITIWVKYVEGKQHDSTKDIFASTSNYVNNTATIQEDDGNDGKSQNTAFYYLQSAVEWIANNGDGNKDYVIKLVDYNDKPFDQGIYFKDSLNGRARSITLTSYDKTKTALQSCSAFAVYVKTTVPIILKNIKISSSAANRSVAECSLILSVEYSYAEVTLDEGTFFEGLNGNTSKYGAAVYLKGGDVYMKKDAKISGFNVEYGGGAVCIKEGHFYMNDNAEISDCHTTGGRDGGGAFYLQTAGYSYVSSYLTIDDNAKIYNCSTNYKGGAIHVQCGEITMNSGSIQNCTASGEYGGCGGAIFLDTYSDQKTSSTAYLFGGTISGNTVNNRGSAIYSCAPKVRDIQDPSKTNYAKVILGGNIFIDPDTNDIYIEKPGDTVKIYSDLETPNPIVALISLYKNSSIAEGLPVLVPHDSNDSEIIENNYSKFQVRIEDSEAPDGYDSTTWRIDEDGLLAANN